MRRNTILVIDDVPEETHPLIASLNEQGYRVLYASSGKEGLALVASKKPAIIICDLDMPDMGGYQVLEAIGRNPEWRRTPFLLAHTEWTAENWSKQAGGRTADTHLSKPYNCREIPIFIKRIFQSIRIIVETPRLILRELEESDIDFVAEMLGDPEVMRFWPRPYTREEAVQWIERFQERYELHGHGYWLAMEKETGQPVGQAGVLNQDVEGVLEIGLGWIMHRPYWRRGFATEAAIGCRDYAFTMENRERIIALIRPENTPSRGVAAKLGMNLEKSVQYSGFEHLVFVSNRTATQGQA
jgi:[ribosomal protein S5]-alanine N-acetyltransferase